MIAPVPAEWSPHRAMWLGFPSHAELWEENLAPAQAETAALARALAGPGKERVRLMVRGDAAEAARPSYLTRHAGVPPQAPADREMWRSAAAAIESYRDRWEITDDRHAFGRQAATLEPSDRAAERAAAEFARAAGYAGLYHPYAMPWPVRDALGRVAMDSPRSSCADAPYPY